MLLQVWSPSSSLEMAALTMRACSEMMGEVGDQGPIVVEVSMMCPGSQLGDHWLYGRSGCGTVSRRSSANRNGQVDSQGLAGWCAVTETDGESRGGVGAALSGSGKVRNGAAWKRLLGWSRPGTSKNASIRRFRKLIETLVALCLKALLLYEPGTPVRDELGCERDPSLGRHRDLDGVRASEARCRRSPIMSNPLTASVPVVTPEPRSRCCAARRRACCCCSIRDGFAGDELLADAGRDRFAPPRWRACCWPVRLSQSRVRVAGRGLDLAPFPHAAAYPYDAETMIRRGGADTDLARGGGARAVVPRGRGGGGANVEISKMMCGSSVRTGARVADSVVALIRLFAANGVARPGL